jgi:hypothetical protein
MREKIGLYRVLLGKTKRKKPLGRPRSKWVEDIKMDLQEVGCRGIDWIDLAQDRDRQWTPFNAVMIFRFHKKTGNFLTS